MVGRLIDRLPHQIIMRVEIMVSNHNLIFLPRLIATTVFSSTLAITPNTNRLFLDLVS